MKPRPQTAWVAVVKKCYADKSELDSLSSGYWLGATRKRLLANVQQNALYPHEWTPVRVTLTPAKPAKKQKGKARP